MPANAVGVKDPFPTVINKDSVIAAATVALTAGQYVEIGRYTLQAGMALALGYDNTSGQDSARGRIYADFRDNAASPGAVINGTLRVTVEDALKREQLIVAEFRTEQLRTSASDRRQQVPFPFINAIAFEDVSFVFRFNADANGTLGKTNSAVTMDATGFKPVY